VAPAKLQRQPQRRAGTRRTRRPGRPSGRTASDGLIADRETLLTAAERLIRRKGPNVSLDAIAAAAGVTKPTLYRGVGDRDALIYALAERLTERMASDVGLRVADASDPHDGLQRLVRGYLEHAAKERNLYLYVSAGAGGDDRIRQSLLLADGSARRFAEGIAAHRASRGADPSVATVWSYGLVGALHFVTLWWLRDPCVEASDVTDHLTALLWPGLDTETPT
jgi:AcrR family transcriptional regulator